MIELTEQEEQRLAQKYTARAKKLTANLTFDECEALLISPLNPLPSKASVNFKEIYHQLSASDEEDASETTRLAADCFVQALLGRKKHFLRGQPLELLVHLSQHLDQKSLSALIASTKKFGMLQDERIDTYVRDKLLEHVVFGRQREAEAIIERYPHLLLKRGTVKNHCGQAIEGTAYQIALGAKDVGYQKDEVAMVEMIERHFKNPNHLSIDAATTAMNRQIQQQFPEGWEEQEKQRAIRDRAALDKVLKAIADSAEGDDCEVALQAFRDHLAPKPGEAIKTGYQANDQLLIDAFTLYEENYYAFGGNFSPKNNLCCQKVIGYIQRFQPACNLQAFAQGIYSIVEKGETLKRMVKFRYEPEVSILPLDTDPDFRLGYEYVADVSPGGEGWPALVAYRRGWSAGAGVSKLCQAKSINVANKSYAAARHRSQQRAPVRARDLPSDALTFFNKLEATTAGDCSQQALINPQSNSS